MAGSGVDAALVESTRWAVLRTKQQVYRWATLLALFACILPMTVAWLGSDEFRTVILVVDGTTFLVCLIGFLMLGRTAWVPVIERIMLGAIITFIGAWDVINLAIGRQPDSGEIVSGAPVFLLACIMLCLIIPTRWQRPLLLTFFAVHTAATWLNLVRFPWGGLQSTQITTDVLTLVAVLLLSVMGRYQRLLMRSEAEARELRELANTDLLTGLLNRRALYPTLEHSEHVVVALIDLDDFKAVNDMYGHERGDAVLAAFAKVLTTCVSERVEVLSAPQVARWGGEEFLVAFPGWAMPRAWARLEAARATVAADPDLVTTMSLGLVRRQAQENVSAMLKRADDLLYAAKRDGKNRIYAEIPQAHLSGLGEAESQSRDRS
ncbi:MAG: GGDEF domain-containing protein [Actinomycetales bacterium]